MVIVPSSNIVLLKTPMELSDNNQLTWSTKQEQYNYFNSLPKLELEEATYVRKEGRIRFPTSQAITYEDIIQYNYCMYQNEAYDDKWFYAYITDITYVNDGMSTIEIETDVWNTWCFDITLKQSFVEREHVNDDTIGKHTIPEDVETGDYIPMDVYKIQYEDYNTEAFYTCFAVSNDRIALSQGTHIYGGIPSGYTYIVVKKEDINAFIEKYTGYPDEIKELFIIPSKLVSASAFEWLITEDNIHYYYPVGSGPLNHVNIPRPATLGSMNNAYTPKNNKLLTKQFSFIMGDNLVGGTTPYYYEYFYDPTACRFNSYGVITPGCSIKAFPIGYKWFQPNPAVVGETSGYSEGLMSAKLPVGSWNVDTYTNWLTQNGVNIGLQVASSGVQLLTGSFTNETSGNAVTKGISSVSNFALDIGNTLGQIYEHTFLPNSVGGNTNSGDVTFTYKESEIHYYRMTIKEEYAKIIDDYLSVYGYKVNSFKVPNIRGRLNWNYVKTIGCNLIGDIPQVDLSKIKNIFDNGVTFWHHSNTFLDYSQSNTILS